MTTARPTSLPSTRIGSAADSRSEPAGACALLQHDGSLRIPDALQDGRGIAVARLERTGEPARHRRANPKGCVAMKLLGARRAHLGLDRERLGLPLR